MSMLYQVTFRIPHFIPFKAWSLQYVQYLQLQPGSQCSHLVTGYFSLQAQGHQVCSRKVEAVTVSKRATQT